MSKPDILIIDDDESVGDSLRSSLGICGYRARWVPALSELPREGDPPNVIVLDLNMPGRDGFATLDGIAASLRDTSVVIASGQHSRIINAAVQTALAAGLNVLGALEKPYRIRELIALIDRGAARSNRQTAQEDATRVAGFFEDGTLTERASVSYQSKRNLMTGQIVGYEALLRIRADPPINPEAAFLPLVPLAAQIQMTADVIRQATADWRTLDILGRASPLAVNCTPAVLCHPDFFRIATALMAQSTMPARMLALELTEQPTLEDTHHVARAASRFSMLGFPMIIDDFGKGTTSYERLITMPISEVKIDKEAFWNCLAGTISPSLIREVLTFCRESGISTTIEGVETEAHRAEAVALGADFGQGYLWDEPAAFSADRDAE
jgi:EAL domain-containing protein (putative c-di-GMP-specific phosphodiesterase class I)/CheY-like chemotaxis protein